MDGGFHELWAGKGWCPGKLSPREGTGAREAGARERDGALPAGARKGWGRCRGAPGRDEAREPGTRGKGPGRLGRGPGRLWPWPGRPGLWGVWRDPRGRDTDPSRKYDLVTEMPGTSPFLPSSSDVAITHGHSEPPIGGSTERARPRASKSALRGPESVTFPASSSPIGPGCGFSRAGRSRESDPVTSLCPHP